MALTPSSDPGEYFGFKQMLRRLAFVGRVCAPAATEDELVQAELLQGLQCVDDPVRRAAHMRQCRVVAAMARATKASPERFCESTTLSPSQPLASTSLATCIIPRGAETPLVHSSSFPRSPYASCVLPSVCQPAVYACV